MAVSPLPEASLSVASGEDPTAAGFSALSSACGVYGLPSRAKLSLTGHDRVRWLNGMVTNNIRDLAAGHGVYAFLLSPQGRILGDLFAYSRGESLLLDIDQAQLPKVLETLKRYIIMDKVEIANVSDSWSAIGVAGPRSPEVLRAAGVEIPELAALDLLELTWKGTPVTVVRGDNSAVTTYELWLEPLNAAKLASALVDAGAQEAGAEAVELLRIASGVPRYGQDIRDRDLPQETGQSRALNFTKGCYIGQEIVERIRARGNVHRMFTGFYVAGELPAGGTKIQAEDKDVGEITSVAALPSRSGESTVALGYIRREAAAKILKAGTAAVQVAELPFRQILLPTSTDRIQTP
jgi:folate-binding protein YgfZ